MKIGILELGYGNVRSVKRALQSQDISVLSISSKEDLKLSFDSLLAPGIGHFQDGVNRLLNFKLKDPIVEYIREGKRFMGICLGAQLLGSRSEEGDGEGLGLIDLPIVSLEKINLSGRKRHIGWYTLQNHQNTEFFSNQNDKEKDLNYFFSHSYGFSARKMSELFPDSTVACVKDTDVVGAFQIGNLLGIQFHIEKSHVHGTELLYKLLDDWSL
jgi:glutamine amidotransferase